MNLIPVVPNSTFVFQVLQVYQFMTDRRERQNALDAVVPNCMLENEGLNYSALMLIDARDLLFKSL